MLEGVSLFMWCCCWCPCACSSAAADVADAATCWAVREKKFNGIPVLFGLARIWGSNEVNLGLWDKRLWSRLW